ncbi:MAG: TonB-dependent receptor [Planctomycetes bacterium]|nr:TonB-dependent receptor [Planctomycetota bacterium]
MAYQSRRTYACTWWLLALTVTGALAEEVPAPADPNAELKNTDLEDITKLSLDDLGAIEVSSVSRRSGQKLFDAPAAVTVITDEDIRRTGHQHMAELLRLVPGMHVARIDANKWAVAARGFNDQFNAQQLVQMDGRTIYTPFFAGVFWIAQDTMLEDLERVEAIRGPGATQWGANAVNGIVSYTSKAAKDTQGLLVTGHGGVPEGGAVAVRYGGKVTDDLHYRVYAKVQEHLEFETGGPIDYSDDWLRWQAGTRFDWDPKDGKDRVTWQGDVYEVERAGTARRVPDLANATVTEEDKSERYGGWNALARWTHDFSPDNQTQLQAFFDHFDAVIPHGETVSNSVLRVANDIVDIDFQHSLAVGERQRMVYGVNYRTVNYEIQNGWSLTFDPTGRRTHAISGFFQDTITAIEDTLEFTVGTKVEYNAFTGFEYQPSFKALYKPVPDHVLWWSASRAVRVPALFENDLLSFVPELVGQGIPVTITGNRGLDSEVVTSFEMGYRTQPLEWFTLDVTGFVNHFDNLIANQAQVGFPPVLEFDNVGESDVIGAELAVHFRPQTNWRVSAHYSVLDAHKAPNDKEGLFPRHQFHARAYFDLTEDLELNAALYYSSGFDARDIPEVLRADVGLTWRPHRQLELSLWGQNLLESEQVEFYSAPTLSRTFAKVPRGFFGKLTFRW